MGPRGASPTDAPCFALAIPMFTGPVFFLVAFLVILLLSTLFSIAETALTSANRFRIRHMAKKGSRAARQAEDLISQPDRVLGTVLIADNLLDVALGSVTTYFVTTALAGPGAEFLQVAAPVAVALVVITFGKLLPKTIAVANAEAVAVRIVLPLKFFMVLLYPVVRLAVKSSNAIARRLRVNTEIGAFPHMLTEEEWRSMLSEEQHHLGKEKQEMLHGVFAIGDKRMREVTIARVDVTALDVHATWDQVLRTAQTSGYSRIPVYRDQFDNIVGILYARDLLPLLMEGRPQGPAAPVLEGLLHPPHYVPDSAKIDVTLRQLQRLHIHMAIVVNEFGGAEGIVTLEDLIEEIIGQIQDEYDREAEAIKKVGPDTYRVEGHLSISELNKELNLAIPETRYYTTLAGFLLTLTGRLLDEGDTVRFRNITFDIEKVDGHRIVSVKLGVKK